MPHYMAFGGSFGNLSNLYPSANCPECGQNRGGKPTEHVCDKAQMIAFQQQKWASEIRNKLEPDLQEYLVSKHGRFLLYLMEQRRI